MNQAAPARPAQQQIPSEKAIVFSKIGQIAEILKEVYRLKLPVLMRVSRTGKAVRGIFSSYSMATGEVTLTGVSAEGVKYLARARALKVEFILLSKKIVFVAEVKSRSVGKVVLVQPDKVLAIERRINVRFKVPASLPAFIEFPDRRVNLDDPGAPYSPEGLIGTARQSPFLRIDDVSLGGVAGFTRYPAIASSVKVGDEQQTAILYFPGHYPVSLPVSVRWLKKTITTDYDGRFEVFRENVGRMLGGGVDESDVVVKESFHRVGVQFAEVSRELDHLLRSFIKQVQQAESI